MSKGNLLIVDDEPVLLTVLKATLTDYADEIFVAEDGVEALKLLEKNQIHCVICDVNMPNLNGLEFIKKVRSENNQVPFIFFTGHGNHELMLEVSKYGAFDFFNKPNFEGLEDSLARGLKSGFKGADGIDTENELMSDYKKMLRDLNN